MATKAKLPSTAVGRRRLLKLSGLLEKDSRRKKGIRFDLNTWGRVDNQDSPISCETYACAMGLAVVSGEFERSGLRHWSQYDLTPVLTVGHTTYIGYEAAAHFFSIDSSATEWLFSSLSYTNGRGAKAECAVAKRIRDFVAGKAAP